MRQPPAPLAAVAVVAFAAAASAQHLTLPRQGENQRSEVRQRIGLVDVAVTYGSPDVHAPDGGDRRGKIWGQLVPWGYADLGFGTCGAKCPWRGGADENTVFATTHDLEVEGEPLAAGRYGLHFLPGESEWTVIFSRDADSWGSFFYDEANDALRVTVKPEKRAYREWLAYDFTDRRPDRATLELQWEELGVPIRLAVPSPAELYYRKIAAELRNEPGFDAAGWAEGARYLASQSHRLDVAERWATTAVDSPQVGRADFDTLSTLAVVKRAAGKPAEAAAAMERAIAHPTATPFGLYGLARPLVRSDPAEALRLFTLGHARFAGAWPLEVGLGRAHAELGDAAQALVHLRKAVAQAPDEGNRRNLERLIGRLEQGDTAIN
jgi:tetratricopeptide (TPR) repeat protein